MKIYIFPIEAAISSQIPISLALSISSPSLRPTGLLLLNYRGPHVLPHLLTLLHNIVRQSADNLHGIHARNTIACEVIII